MNLEKAIRKINKLEKENKELKELCKDLERRLRIYENPNTPPSKLIIKDIKKDRKPRKRGAPKGHKGATRKRPKPDKIVELSPTTCPKCKQKHIRIIKGRKNTSEDIEVIKVVTEFHFYECVCEDCGKKFTTSDKKLPKTGNFGPNILTLWIMLHYHGIIPFDRLATISRNCFEIDVTPAGIHNAIYRTANMFETRFNRIKNRVIKSDYLGSDETCFPFNGKRNWLWIYTTLRDTLVLLRESRGSCVLKEIFGDFLDAILSSDCYKAYEKFKAREYQKDWAHLMRSAKDLAKHNREGEELYKMISRMYKYIQKVKKERLENMPKVKFWVRQQKKKIRSWLGWKFESKASLNLVIRMVKCMEDWFTCLKYPHVDPTNNATERDIRKNVIARKISGQHRSRQGQHCREIMMSIILTLNKRGQNPFDFVRNGIGRYNMGLIVS